MVKLDRVSRSQLHATFHEAFSDYSVDMSSLTEERLRIRFEKNGVDWDVSVGAFDGERMVGFTIVGVDAWEEGMGAFDAATGIVPGFRGQGLAKRMFEHALPGLETKGVKTFVLEVIADNEPAIRAYEKTGFGIKRRFHCYGLGLQDLVVRQAQASAIDIRQIDRQEIRELAGEVDWSPSWENSFGAIERIPDELICLGAYGGNRCVGAIAYSPAMNWIMMLVVRKGFRRQGVGSLLVRELVEGLRDSVAAIKAINVDSSDRGMVAFLLAIGFEHLIDQYEMVRPI